MRAGPNRTLRIAIPLVDLTENILVGDEDVGKRHLAVTADHRLVDDVDVPINADPGGLGGRQEHRGAATIADLPGGARHDDVETGPVGAGDEPLAAGDRPAAVDLGRRRRQLVGVRARPGRRGFGHRECTSDLPSGQRPEVFVALVLARDVGEHVNVALVGGADVQRYRAEGGGAGGGEHRRAVGHVQAEPAVLDRRMGGEDAGRLRLRVEFPPQIVAAGGFDVAVEPILHRQHLLGDELRGTSYQVVNLR